MEIVGYVIYAIGIIVAFGWMMGTRHKVKSGDGVQIQTLGTLFLFLVSLIIVPILKWSPLNLLWMYPASFVLGTLSLSWPVGVLQPFGNLVGMIACFGLDQTEIANNKRRRQRIIELVSNEKLSVDGAMKKMQENGEW